MSDETVMRLSIAIAALKDIAIGQHFDASEHTSTAAKTLKELGYDDFLRSYGIEDRAAEE